jgi:transposase-like protein
MPGGRPTKYDPAYCERVIELGRQGKSQVQISAAIDVPRTTILSWAEQYPEFSTALMRAKEFEQDWWENAGQNGIFLDKFNATVWKTSMAARFRDDYTERKEVNANVRISHEDVLDDLASED